MYNDPLILTEEEEKQISDISGLASDKRKSLLAKIDHTIKEIENFKRRYFNKSRTADANSDEADPLAYTYKLEIFRIKGSVFEPVEDRITNRIKKLKEYREKIEEQSHVSSSVVTTIDKDSIEKPQPAVTISSSPAAVSQPPEETPQYNLKYLVEVFEKRDKYDETFDADHLQKYFEKLIKDLPTLKKIVKEELLNQPDILGELLIYACHYQSPEAVNFLLDCGANPDFKNAFGDCPLNIAIRKEDKNLVEILLKRGANPNIYFKHKTLKSSPVPLLNLAIFNIKSESVSIPIVELLLNFGADPLMPPIPRKLDKVMLGATGDITFTLNGAISIKKTKIVELLKKHTGTSKYNDLYKKHEIFKKTGAILGLNMNFLFDYPDGSKMEINSSGGHPYESISWIANYLNQYCQKLDKEARKESKAIFERIFKAYAFEAKRLVDPKVTLNEVVSAYNTGDFVFMSGGWQGDPQSNMYGHAVGLAFHKDNVGFVNRGFGGLRDDCGSGAFKRDERYQIDSNLLAKLDYPLLKSKQDVENYMHSISDLAGNNPIEFLGTKPQKWGTCYFCNYKPGIEWFLFWGFLELGYDKETARKRALKEYKDFTEFMRNKMCEELVSNYASIKKAEDRVFFEALFSTIIAEHHGKMVMAPDEHYVIPPYDKSKPAFSFNMKAPGRSGAKKVVAELDRDAMLIQAVATADRDPSKAHTHEFINSLISKRRTINDEMNDLLPLLIRRGVKTILGKEISDNEVDAEQRGEPGIFGIPEKFEILSSFHFTQKEIWAYKAEKSELLQRVLIDCGYIESPKTRAEFSQPIVKFSNPPPQAKPQAKGAAPVRDIPPVRVAHGVLFPPKPIKPKPEEEQKGGAAPVKKV